MAARENQGLQIALIIFVMLTIVLAVTTYVFFSSSQEYQTKAKTADDARNTSETAMRTAIEESTEFRKLLGADGKAKREDIAKKFADETNAGGSAFFGKAVRQYDTGMAGEIAHEQVFAGE